MKALITSTLVIVLLSCHSVKNIYSTNDISDRQLEKLVNNYLKKPSDTAAANRVVYAYNLVLSDHLNHIASLQKRRDLQSLERLPAAWRALQTFYDDACRYPEVRELVNPGDVTMEYNQALSDASEAWYYEGERLLSVNNWQTGREAHRVFRKVHSWIPNYRSVNDLMDEAFEQGIIDAVIQPLRSEGFFYNSGYRQTAGRFTYQLVSDLSNNWNNRGDWYRVYDAQEVWNGQLNPDWIIEPVITRMRIEPVKYNRSTRTVTKQIETGKDSLKNPVYKTISAELTITEASVYAVTDLEARITDAPTNKRLERKFFNESITLREVSATYKGDKNALSNEDLQLVNNRNQLRVDERWLQEKLLEKIYPDLLSWLRNRLH